MKFDLQIIRIIFLLLYKSALSIAHTYMLSSLIFGMPQNFEEETDKRSI
jgi:hypothetical protein